MGRDSTRREAPGGDPGELSWEDARTFLAIARSRSLNGAARKLGVHHSTVFRRLTRLESLLGTPLFDRQGSRYTLTAAGEALQVHAERVEDELLAMQRAALGNELLPSGTLRLTTLESLLPWVLPALTTLQARCPQLRVELDATTETRELDRRDADVALRPSESPPGDAVGRRIAALAWAGYRAAAAKGDQHALVGYVGPLAALKGPRQALTALPRLPAPGRLSARTVAAMAEALAQGFGIGALPCYQGDSDPRLIRVGEPRSPGPSALWLLMHPDLRESARMRAIIDLLVPVLAPHAPLFAGQRPWRTGRRN